MKKAIKLIITIISIIAMYFAFDYFSVTSPKRVKFNQLDEFRQEVLNDYNVSEIDIYFFRPSLFIEINSEEKLTNEITSLFYVRIYFNEIKENTKIKYLEIELSQRKDYKDWN